MAGSSGATASETRSVTLVTGDRVLVLDGKPRSVEPGTGRAGMSVHISAMRNRLHVIPADARPRAAAGRVDRRLFDVTTLLEFGYDDLSRATVPLIVTGQGARTGCGRRPRGIFPR